MRRPKVIVVGAGPAGGACALTLARSSNAEVVLLDKSTYPRVKVCGSGLSPYGIDLLERLELKERFRRQHIPLAGMRAQGPDGGTVHRHFQPDVGLTPRQQSHYRAQTALSMLPKFWAGEGFVRGMRSKFVRSMVSRINPQRFAERATVLLGETHA